MNEYREQDRRWFRACELDATWYNCATTKAHLLTAPRSSGLRALGCDRRRSIPDHQVSLARHDQLHCETCERLSGPSLGQLLTGLTPKERRAVAYAASCLIYNQDDPRYCEHSVAARNSVRRRIRWVVRAIDPDYHGSWEDKIEGPNRIIPEDDCCMAGPAASPVGETQT